MRLSLETIARAIGGEVRLGAAPPRGGAGHEVDGYSIDSRTARANDLFFAIVGPRHDGHDFVKDAVGRGAAAAVVAAGGPGRFPEAPALIRVADTTRALQDLGAFARRRRPLLVVGITGSAGKTTAKEMAAAVLEERLPALKTEGNLNNTYGLPLMLLRLEERHRAAVLEMGMSTPGEIARLAEIADPDVGVLLNVLRVHLEHFGSLAKIAAAKGELFRGLRRDAVAVYNADDAHAARLGRAFPGARLAYGIASRAAEVRAESIEAEGLEGTRFVLRRGSDRAAVRLAFPGRHHVYNALAAAASGFALGLEAADAARGLMKARPAAMRGVLRRRADGVQVLDDSYNSNPAAMDQAIALLATAAPGGVRRVLVAGDMLELGAYATRAHARLGERVARAGIEVFVAVGPLMAGAARAARAAGAAEVHHFPDADAAAAFAAGAVRPGDLVLVKGSRGMKTERVVRALLGGTGGGGEAH